MADPTEYAQVCGVGLGKGSHRLAASLTDADWPSLRGIPVRQTNARYPLTVGQLGRGRECCAVRRCGFNGPWGRLLFKELFRSFATSERARRVATPFLLRER